MFVRENELNEETFDRITVLLVIWQVSYSDIARETGVFARNRLLYGELETDHLTDISDTEPRECLKNGRVGVFLSNVMLSL